VGTRESDAGPSLPNGHPRATRRRRAVRNRPPGRAQFCSVFRNGSLANVTSARSGSQFKWGDKAPARLGRIEYRLMRESILRDYRRGRLGRLDVCDAQSELMRVAKNLGRATDTDCPICEQAHVRVLPKSSRKDAEVLCYLVEVCTECAWNHLVSVFAPRGLDR